MAFYFFKKRWFAACLLSFLLQKFAKVAIIVSRLFQKTASKPQQIDISLKFIDTSLRSVWQILVILSFHRKRKISYICHFEQSALEQSKIHIESVSVVRYSYFV